MDFGTQIKNAREAKCWNQAELAQHLGVTQQAVQKWEGQRFPPLRSRHLPELCALLGIDIPGLTMRGQDVVFSTASDDAVQRLIIGPPKGRLAKEGLTKVRPQIDDVFDDMHKLLPEEYRGAIAGSVFVQGLPYKFLYTSKKVIVHLVHETPNVIMNRMRVRSAAWRLFVAKNANNDVPVSSSHYMLAVMALPSEDRPIKPDNFIGTESKVTGLDIIFFPDTGHLAKYICNLENMPTEADEFFSDAGTVLYEDSDEIPW